MSDYIKRDDALNIDFKIIVRAFENRKTTATNAVQAYADAIAKIPSEDVRPVVLCKDCVYSNKWYADRLICHLWNEHNGNAVFEDGFCNYGLKREES